MNYLCSRLGVPAVRDPRHSEGELDGTACGPCLRSRAGAGIRRCNLSRLPEIHGMNPRRTAGVQVDLFHLWGSVAPPPSWRKVSACSEFVVLQQGLCHGCHNLHVATLAEWLVCLGRVLNRRSSHPSSRHESGHNRRGIGPIRHGNHRPEGGSGNPQSGYQESPTHHCLPASRQNIPEEGQPVAPIHPD